MRERVDAFFDTWLQDNLRTRFIYYGWANADQEALAQMITSPHGLIGDSAGYRFPFTAIFSCFPARNAGAMDALI